LESLERAPTRKSREMTRDLRVGARSSDSKLHRYSSQPSEWPTH